MELEETVLHALARAISGGDADAVETVAEVKEEAPPGQVIECGATVALGDYPAPSLGGGGAAVASDAEWAEHRVILGLQMVQHVVTERWDQCDAATRAAAKDTAFTLADTFATDPGVLADSGSRFLLRKSAAVVADLAVREWPQRWPDLFDGLVDRADSDGGCGGYAFFAAAVIRALLEEVHEFGHTIEGDRRRDLVKSLAEIADVYLGLLARCLAAALETLRQEEAPAAEAVLTEVLEALKPCFEHTPLPPLLDVGVLPELCELLQHGGLRLTAADCLLLGVARKGPLADRAPLLALLDNFELVSAAVPDGDPHNADDHTFLKRLAQFVSVLGSNQLCAIWSSKGLQKDAPPNFGEYLFAIMTLLQHKSRLVSSFALAAWIQVFKHDLAVKHEVMHEAIGPLIETVLDALVRRGSMADGFGGDAELEAYALLDFDDDEDYTEFFGIYRNNLNNLSRLIASAFPEQALYAAVGQLVSVSEQPGAMAVEWEAATVFIVQVLGVTFASIKRAPAKYGEVLGAISGVLKAVTGDAVEGTADVQAQLFALVEALVPTLHFLDAELGEAALHMVLAGIRFESGGADGAAAWGEGEAGWKGDGARVRHKACQALTAFCKKPPPALFGAFDEICGSVQDVMALPTTTEMTRKWLMKACVEAGNHLPSLEEQRDYLQQLLAPTLTDLESAAVQGAIESPEALAAFGGLYAGDPTPFKEPRQLLIGTLQAISVALDGTASRGDVGEAVAITVRGGGGSPHGGDGRESACVEVIEASLPAVLQLIGIIHRTWEPGITPDDFAPLLEMRRADVALLLARSGRTLPRDLSADELVVDRAQLWLGTLRESAYRVVRAAARQGLLYSMDDLLGVLSETCFAAVEHMHPQHVQQLLKTVAVPMVQFAPRSDDGAAFLAAVLTNWYGELRGYLEVRWERHAEVAAHHGVDQANPLEEVLENSLLSGLTQDVVSHLAQLIADNTAKARRGVEPSQLGPLTTELLAEDGVAENIFHLLMSALCWPHSLSARVAADAVTAVIDHLLESSVFQDLVGSGHVLNQALLGLSTHGADDACCNSLIGLVAAVFKVARVYDVESAIEPLSAVPGCDRRGALDGLDSALKSADTPAKVLKPLLRQMLQPIIGAHVGQLRREVKITALPDRLFLLSEERKAAERDAEDTEEGLTEFFEIFDE